MLIFQMNLKKLRAHIDTMDANALGGIVARAIENIKTQLQLIFGKQDDLSTYMFADLGLEGLQLSDWNNGILQNRVGTE